MKFTFFSETVKCSTLSVEVKQYNLQFANKFDMYTY